MRNSVLVCTVLLLLFTGVSTITAAPVQAGGEGSKIGFIDSNGVLQGTQEGQKILGELEAFVSERQIKVDAQASQLEELRNQYQSQARMLNPETAAEMEKSIREKETGLRRLQEDMELEVNRRQTELLNGISGKIQEVISAYAEQNGFGVVFLENPSLPYFAPALDITPAIIKAYDEKYPAAAPGASQ